MDSRGFYKQFDLLYNNITSNQAPGLTVDEVSMILTKAQNELLKNYFFPSHNAKQTGIDGSTRRQLDFANLIEVIRMEYVSNPLTKLDSRSSVYKYPDNKHIMFVINEVFYIIGEKKEGESTLNEVRQVIPLSYTEYTRLMQKPLKEPLKNQVWKLTNGNYFELIFNTDDVKKKESKETDWFIRYVRYPKAIELDITKEGDSPCELDETMHEEIIQRAVELAKNIWLGNLESTVQLGQRAE